MNTINRYLTVTGFLITDCRIVVDIPEGSDATKGIFKLHNTATFFFFSPKKLDVQKHRELQIIIMIVAL